jgi:hemoglobin
MKHDIAHKDDLVLLIDTFYARLLKVDGMPEVFAGLNFESHKPLIVQFWALVLLDEDGYTTNVFDKHLHLPIKAHMFQQWLQVFVEVVNDLFEGEKAQMAIQRATVLTYTFESKWQKVKGE